MKPRPLSPKTNQTVFDKRGQRVVTKSFLCTFFKLRMKSIRTKVKERQNEDVNVSLFGGLTTDVNSCLLLGHLGLVWKRSVIQPRTQTLMAPERKKENPHNSWVSLSSII